MDETNNRKGCVVGGCFIGELGGLEENLLKSLEGRWREEDCEFNVILLHSRFKDSPSYMRSCLFLLLF